MFAKILIKAEIEVVTGMHIGAGGGFSAIGAVDSPVIMDPLERLPIIPGSSLKGKMRSVLARKYSPGEVKNDDERIKRLFGAMGKATRLYFSDSKLNNKEELLEMGVSSVTEVKFENTINRATGTAEHPRQIERVIPGAKFTADMIYNVYDTEGNTVTMDEIKEDFALLAEGFKLLGYDYLGGNGSRGYGRIKFNSIEVISLTEGKGSDIAKIADQVFKEMKV